ncbi:DUF2871 domain-containing protein [uncultured Leifsonia sp.]|uniref:DUF2871 domain-containing protein n=1 Tax=uncultured Leifsonia sp. TaxID=340359 RepID=UPI0025EB8F4E|nr:DUF2871 domain-containing protein [uncultured Leifsonia sp.]
MRRIYLAAAVYVGLGLASGLFYRDFTQLNHFPETGSTQLSGVHTHFLALGALVMLILLGLEKLFTLSASRSFTWFFWIYNAGLVITGGTMIWHGVLTVLGQTAGPMVAGVAGIGHILLTAAFVLLLVALGKAIRRATPAVAASAAEPTLLTAPTAD